MPDHMQQLRILARTELNVIWSVGIIKLTLNAFQRATGRTWNIIRYGDHQLPECSNSSKNDVREKVYEIK
jgi:hypothetical protein